MVQFRLHNIQINDKSQLAMIDMPLKWHHIDKCENKLEKFGILT